MAMNALNQRRTNNRLKNISLVLGIVILAALCLVLASCAGLFTPGASATKPAVSNPGPDVQAPATAIPAVEPTAIVQAEEPPVSTETTLSPVVIYPITRDSGYVEVARVSKVGTFEPAWPEGTEETSTGYSNPEEFPEGRSFMTRNPSSADEVLAFVARCVSVNGGRKVCQGESAGALVGLILGSSEGEFPVTLWDAELKTLTIPGGLVSWEKYITILGEFISANKGGKPVIVLGPAN
jgi:hypothetical protein